MSDLLIIITTHVGCCLTGVALGFNIDGEDWPVVRVSDEKIIAAFDVQGKTLKQVYPNAK